MKYYILESLLSAEIITAENVVTILQGGEEASSLIALLLKAGKINIPQADTLLQRSNPTPVITYSPPQPIEAEIPYYQRCGCTICNCTLGGWTTTSSAAPGPTKR